MARYMRFKDSLDTGDEAYTKEILFELKDSWILTIFLS